MTVKIQAEDILRVRYAFAKRVLQCRRPGESIKDATHRVQKVSLLTLAGFQDEYLSNLASRRDDRGQQLEAEVHTLQLEIERLKMANNILAGKVADLQASTETPPVKGRGQKSAKQSASGVLPHVALVLDEINMSDFFERVGVVSATNIEPVASTISRNSDVQSSANHWPVLLAVRSLQLACASNQKASPSVQQEQQLRLIRKHTARILRDIGRRIAGLLQGLPRILNEDVNTQSAGQQIQSFAKLCITCLQLAFRCLGSVPAVAMTGAEHDVMLSETIITSLCECFATHSRIKYASVPVSAKQTSHATATSPLLNVRTAAYDMLHALCTASLLDDSGTGESTAGLRSFCARRVQCEIIKQLYDTLQSPDLQVDITSLRTKDERLQSLLSISAVQDAVEYHCRLLSMTVSIDSGTAGDDLAISAAGSLGLSGADVDDHRILVMLEWCLSAVSDSHTVLESDVLDGVEGMLPTTTSKNLGYRTTSRIFETVDSLILARGPDLVDQAMQQLLLLE